MKKIIAGLLALGCLLGLLGCGKDSQPQAANPTTAATAPTAAPSQGTSAAPSQGASGVPTQAPTQATQPAQTTQAVHQEHTYGDWVLKSTPSCTAEGRKERRCTVCDAVESSVVPKAGHKLNTLNICTKCYLVSFDEKSPLVELGVICDSWYGSGKEANYAWDLRVWNGKVYRAAGDYDKNSGATTILAYDIASHTWLKTGTAADEAIHGFEIIGGSLVAPGIDATAGWQYGNYYVLQEDGSWKQMRNLPNGVHCFDMIQCGDLIFAGLGTENPGNTVAVSSDGGKSFTFAPLYKDGQLIDVSQFEYSRTYEFLQLEGKVYCLTRLQTKTGYARWWVFGYEDGKMHYMAEGTKLLDGSSFSRKYFGGEFELNGTCYVASRGLYTIRDFSDPTSWKTVSMPNSGKVSDAILRDGVIYTLTSRQDMNTKLYKTVIYKSTTGEAGSFVEVASYDYGGFPLSFDFDGTYFYVGTGKNELDKTKNGMVLRVAPNAVS